MNTQQSGPEAGPYYPPVAFAFRLQMVGSGMPQDEAGFQEVSGLSMEMDTEPYHEGGQNQFTHKLPNGVNGGTLVLKRGFIAKEKPLYLWCERILQGGLNSPIQPATFNLQLLSAQSTSSIAIQGDVLKSWTFLRAWPTKWDISGFNSMESQVVLESLELSYTTVVRTHAPGS
ncbi:phage tail protein [Prosthecobacter sp.]|jgi:phage tail-like protein|uniref:phage tail protein n=1 Tax=Prosthecobacter sp. TaxID=1965333 RepID=UPI0037C5AB11